MPITTALNSILGSVLVIILIFADYIRQHNTDAFQRLIFLGVLLTTMVSMLSEFVFFTGSKYPGRMVHYVLYASLMVYYIFQIAAFYYLVIFFDYLCFKDRTRIKKLNKIVWAIFILHGISLIANISMGFYFYLTPENLFVRGDKFYIRLVIGYFPSVMMILDLFFLGKNFKKSQVYLIFFFLIFTSLGSIVDIVCNTNGLIWPCFISGLLYAYFFIIRSDSKIDILTGIGNRYSFNEFIAQVSHQNAKQPYAVVMIDMDDFKKINDTLGHLEGDNALRDLATIIKGSIRLSDFAARYGGDEFILAAKEESDIVRLMERIQQAIDSQNEKKVRPYRIQISYGRDVFTPNSGQSIEAFLSHIDSLMYKHKAAKRRSTD
jgi:diguanylate cyclase (GGDEF)-like protein